MAKLTLTDLSSLSNQTSAITLLNNNSAAIETALENTLSRDGTSPNAMEANLDMNSNRIINLPAPAADHEAARKIDVDNLALVAGAGDALTSSPLSQFAATTSAQLAGVISDETGSGALVFAASPTLSGTVTVSGTVAATTITGNGAGITNLDAANIATGTVNTSRLGSGTPGSGNFLRGDGTWTSIPGGGDALVANPLSQFAATTSAQLAGVMSDETGTGSLVFANTPTLVTPVLGTPTSGTLTNCTGLPVATGISGLAAGVATFLATPSSANLASAITNETGSGSLTFATSPSFTTDIRPVTNNTTTLGTSSLAFGDLFLGSGGTIDFAAGDVVLTHATGEIAITTATNLYRADTNPAVNNIAGWSLLTGGKVSASVDSGQAADFNRKTNDGTIINFRQDGTVEGAVSVAGTLLTYATFTGSHWSQPANGKQDKILPGTVIETVDEMCIWNEEDINEHLPKFKVSDKKAARRVYGVFLAWDETDHNGDAFIVSLGTYVVRIAKDEVVEGGDLVESNGDGCACAQLDDVVRSSTIGKVTSGKIVKTYEDGSYLVPCVLYCG